MRGSSLPTTLSYLGGLLLVFAGERLVGAGPFRWLTAGGIALIALALALRGARLARGPEDGRTVEKSLLALYALGLFGVALYALQSDLGGSLFDKPLERSAPRLQVVLAALWPAVILVSLLPTALIELAYAAMARAPVLERGRIRDALLSGLGVAFALIFAFTVAYVAAERDRKVDLSYFRTAKVGEATRKIVMTLDQPVQIALFFPPANEVREQVDGYVTDLATISKLVEVQRYDHAVDVSVAKELGVTGNGTVVVKRGGRKEQLAIGLELESARGQLGGLDRELQKRLLLVAKPTRTVYLVTGHGERSSESSGETDKRATVRDLRELMVQQGYQVRTLGAGEGLAAEVPADAAMVLLLGPQKPLLVEEERALGRYVERGGRLFVALDPEAGVAPKALLGGLGLAFSPTVLANDQVYARRSYQNSDRQNIATGSFSSHPSVTTLGRMAMRAPLILVGAGSLEEVKERAKELALDFTVHAHFASWADGNGNFQFDGPAEVRKAWEIAAAVTRRQAEAKDSKDEGRAVVLADSDAVCDGVVGNPGNAYFVLDSMKWLLGDEAITGEVASEVDVPVAHTRKQDIFWFYSSIFVAPTLVLGLGLLASRRRRGRGAKRKEATP